MGFYRRDFKSVFKGHWRTLWRLEHSRGCYGSDEPDIMVKNHTDPPIMTKSLHLKLCDGARFNVEGILLGMTGDRGDNAFGAVQDDDYMVLKMFFAHAGGEARQIYKAVEGINGWSGMLGRIPSWSPAV